MGGEELAERIAEMVVAVNVLMRKKGAAGLEVRVVKDAGRMWVRTDQVDRDGTRRMRQESPELGPQQALDYLEKLRAALGKA